MPAYHAGLRARTHAGGLLAASVRSLDGRYGGEALACVQSLEARLHRRLGGARAGMVACVVTDVVSVCAPVILNNKELEVNDD